MNKKLTKRIVENTAPLIDKQIILWDSELKGLGVRIYPTGRKLYFIQYRNQFKRSHRIKLGIHGVITTEQARDMARQYLGDIAKGSDPASDKKSKNQIPTLNEFAQDYLAIYAKNAKRERSYKEDMRILQKIVLKRLGTKNIQEITSKDLSMLHADLKGTPYQANRVRSLLSKMFNLAIEWNLIQINPAKKVRRYQEYEKTRWLDEEELQKLWGALEHYHSQSFANIIRLLILTGSRKSEVLHATWDQFDLLKGIWTKPAHTTKQKQLEYLPLSDQALTLLKEMKQKCTDVSSYLFPGKIPGKPVREIKRAWTTILRQAGLKNVRIHDLRHTHASHLVSDGQDLYTVGKLLGHTQVSTTKKYAHLANQPLRKATRSFGDKIEKLVSNPRQACGDCYS